MQEKDAVIRLRINSSKKTSWQKWAARRNISLSSLVAQSVSYFVAAHPVEGYHDEARMARNLASKEGVNDESNV